MVWPIFLYQPALCSGCGAVVKGRAWLIQYSDYHNIARYYVSHRVTECKEACT